VCDSTNQESLIGTLQWKTIIQENSEYEEKLPILLVQNKLDLVEGKDENEMKIF
jgi:GTPase SAR1 family protein